MHLRVLCKSYGQRICISWKVGKHILTIIVFWEHRLQAKFNTVDSLVLDDSDGDDDGDGDGVVKETMVVMEMVMGQGLDSHCQGGYPGVKE